MLDGWGLEGTGVGCCWLFACKIGDVNLRVSVTLELVDKVLSILDGEVFRRKGVLVFKERRENSIDWCGISREEK